MLSVHNKIKFCGKNMDIICHFDPFVYYIYIYIYILANVIVGFGSFAVLGCKDL